MTETAEAIHILDMLDARANSRWSICGRILKSEQIPHGAENHRWLQPEDYEYGEGMCAACMRCIEAYRARWTAWLRS